MRTTLRLDDRVMREAKRLALETGSTLGGIIDDLLREALERRRARRTSAAPARLPVLDGRGPRPGVDLDDTAGLLDASGGGPAPS